MRRYIISHFNEPIDIASSSLGEKHAIYGGSANLKLGLKNVTSKYKPQLIGVATTCLTETIGDDVKMIIHEYIKEFHTGSNDPLIISVSTPSYSGTHMEGFNAALKGVVEQLSEGGDRTDTINILPGFLSAADLRYLKDLLADFGLNATVLPDYSETLDGEALNEYPLIPKGGTPLAAIRAMGKSALTIECGHTLPEATAGTRLEEMFEVPLTRVGAPMGIRETDIFMDALSKAAGITIPERYRKARGRLIDAMVDGHKYIFGKRAVIYGEEDLVVGLTSLLAEIGVIPVLCASGGKSGKFRESIDKVLSGMNCEMPEVHENVDFFDIQERAQEHARLPGHDRVGRQVGHPDQVVIVRPLAHPDRRGAGEPRAPADELVEGAGRDALAARRPVDVDPLGEHVGDAVVPEAFRDRLLGWSLVLRGSGHVRPPSRGCP
jgi:nitrogenase molybdenum-iron protein NifN